MVSTRANIMILIIIGYLINYSMLFKIDYNNKNSKENDIKIKFDNLIRNKIINYSFKDFKKVSNFLYYLVIKDIIIFQN
jgi:hypothetical protein